VAAAVGALEEGSGSMFTFVGASEAEMVALRSVDGVGIWLSRGRISLLRAVPRSEIPQLLANSDVGLSLIPPKPVYVESSPTKLAEYFSAGLLVLASKGIPMQEEYVTKSHAGVLVDWSVLEMVKGIRKMEQFSSADVELARQKGKQFAKQHLSYRAHLNAFMSLTQAV
jgi:hypothetical protein